MSTGVLQTLKEIKKYLSILQTRVKNENSSGNTDINNEAELLFIPILNIILRDANLKKIKWETRKEPPGVDLGCTKTKIAVQVTSDNSADKVRDAIKKFLNPEYKYLEKYEKLYFLFIGDSYKPKESTIDEFKKSILDLLNNDYADAYIKVSNDRYKLKEKEFSWEDIFKKEYIYNVSDIILKLEEHWIEEQSIEDIKRIKNLLYAEILDEIEKNRVDLTDLFFFDSLSEKLRARVENKKEINILQAAVEVIKHFDGINFFPNSIFRLYPFSINKDFHLINFSLKTNSTDFFNLVDNLINREIKEYSTDEEKLIDFLQNQQINHIHGVDNKSLCVHTLFLNRKACECAVCSYERLNFQKVYEKINQPMDSLNDFDKLSNAYVHFYIGNYKKSFELYKNLAETYKQSKKYILYFICSYNLSVLYSNLKLSVVISDSPTKNEELKEIEKFYTELDLDKILTELRAISGIQDEIIQFLSYIKEGKFFDIWNILNENQKIKKEYEEHKKGSIHYSYGQESTVLENIFQVFAVTRYNFILHKHNFRILLHECLEAFWALYDIHKDDNTSNYSSITDFLLNVIVFNQDSSTLIRFFQKSNLGLVKYNSTHHTASDFFTTAVKNFIASYYLIKTDIHDNKKIFFVQLPVNVLENILVLFANVDFQVEYIDECLNEMIDANIITDYLKQNEIFSHFLEKRGSDLKEHTLERLLELILGKDDYIWHINTEIEIIINKIVEKNPNYKLRKEIENKILTYKDSENQENYLRRIIKLYRLTNMSNYIDSYRTIFTTYLTENINPINSSIFWACINYNIVEFKNDALMGKVIGYIPADWIELPKNKLRNYSLNEFIHYAYRFNKCLEIVEEQKLHKNIPYYKWLSNPEAFDYETFEPIWLIYYKNEYYFERFKKIPAIKQAIEKSLKNNFNDELSKIYIEYFIA